MKTIAILSIENNSSDPSGPSSISGIAKCSECQMWAEIPTDYTSMPMIWCDECGGRFVLNLATKKYIDVDLKKEYEIYSQVHDTSLMYELRTFSEIERKEYKSEDVPCYGMYIYRGRGIDFDTFEVELYHIKKISNGLLVDLEFIDIVSEEKKHEYIINLFDYLYKVRDDMKNKSNNSIKVNNEELKQFNMRHREMTIDGSLENATIYMGELKTYLYPHLTQNIFNPPEYIEKKYIDIPVYFNVNSCNSEKPLVKYHEKFNVNHDGVYIYLICEDETGKEFLMSYWGD